MNLFRKSILAVAAMGAILISGQTAARAGMNLELKYDANPWVTVASSNIDPHDALFNGNFGSTGVGGTQFTLRLLVTSSNSPGVPTLSFVTSGNSNIKNNNGAKHTLGIRVGDINFSAPTAPPSLRVNSHIGTTTVVDNLLNKMTFQSFVNQDNSQNGTTGVSPGLQGPPQIDITKNSSSNDKFLTITSLGSPYSITEQMFITLGGKSIVNFSTNTALVPVPEPSTMALAGLGALGLIGYGIRRRKGA